MLPASRPVGEALVLDSSCWLEVFSQSNRAHLFTESVQNVGALLIPVLTIYEVFKVLRRDKGDESATRALTYMQCGQVIDIDSHLVAQAACNGLPLADSLIYATALQHGATVWTQDAHLEGLPSVKYFPKSQHAEPLSLQLTTPATHA